MTYHQHRNMSFYVNQYCRCKKLFYKLKLLVSENDMSNLMHLKDPMISLCSNGNKVIT